MFPRLQKLKSLYLVADFVRAFRNVFNQPSWKIKQPIVIDSTTTNSPKSKKHVLLATGGGGNTAAMSVESALGVALLARGHKVSALLCDEALPACFQSTLDFDNNEKRFANKGPTRLNCATCFRPANKVYESLGISVLRLSDHISDSELKASEKLAEEISLEALCKYQIDDVNVGEHAHAGALRFYARGVLTDAHSEKVLRRYFLAALKTHHAVKRLIASKAITSVALHHGLYVPQGIIAETSRTNGAKVSIWHVAYRKQTFMFSHDETYHHSLMTEPVGNWQHMDWSEALRQKTIDYLNSRWYGTGDWVTFNKNSETEKSKIISELGFDPSKPMVLALTNVVWDAQLHYPTNVFGSMIEWLIYTVEWFETRNHLQLTIRVHPAEVTGTVPSRQLMKDELLKHFGQLPGNVFLVDSSNNLSTYTLAEMSNAALIYGTKMGVELSAKGKQVIVAGEAWIRGKGVTIDPASIEAYKNALEELPFHGSLDASLQERALKYAYHFFFRRMIPLKFMKHVSGSRLFEVDVNNEEELFTGADLGLDVICDGITKERPFIFQDELQ